MDLGILILNNFIIFEYYVKLFPIFVLNPLASTSAGAPALNYGDVNTVTTSPGEVKGLIPPKKFFLKSGI